MSQDPLTTYAAASSETDGSGQDADASDCKSVTIVIPAYNEQDAIGTVLEAIDATMSECDWRYEVVVVDDGSTDETAAVVKRYPVRLIELPDNRGYGMALTTGIEAARTELIVIIDADTTYPASAIPTLLSHADRYDMVVGARTGEDVNVPLIRRPAKALLRWLASYLAEQPIPDLNSGLRVVKRTLVRRFRNMLPSGLSFTTTITLALLCNNYHVYYVPINYRKRIGSSSVRPSDAYRFLIQILRTVTFYNPLRIFLPTGTILFVAGFIKLCYDLFWVDPPNLSESAVMAILGAIILWALGLISDQIARTGPHSG